MRLFVWLFATSCFLACAARADVVVYDDSLQNGFLDYSYVSGAGSYNFASTAQHHTGTQSIAFTAGGYDAVKVANNTTLFDTATNPRFALWFYGTAAQCQGLDLILERDDGAGDITVASAALSGFAACSSIVNGQWFPIIADFTAAPMSYNGTYSRISLFNHNGGAFGPVYFDDLALLPPNEIFKNGFEGSSLPPPPCGMIDAYVTVDTMMSDKFSWCDSAGKPRTAVLAHNDSATVGPGGTRGGELRQFSYQIGASTRTVNASSSGTAGFGYPVSHPGGDAFHCTGVKLDNTYSDPYDDNGLIGHLRGGSFTRVFVGRHHAIFRFQMTYPLYCSTVNTAPLGYLVPVTIDWVFSSGHDNPMWMITWDMKAAGAPAGKLEYDSRAPYGELLFDGSATEGGHSPIAGVAWGDQFKFTSTTNPVTRNSAWTWNQANTIPYVKLWTTAIDATMGTVMTQPITQFDVAGYFDVVKFWNHTSADALANCQGAGYTMPCINYWSYQSINDSFTGDDIPTNNTRLAWGTEFGFLGLSGYHIHGSTYWGGPLADVPASGFPRKSYSAYVVLGTHSNDPVDSEVAQVEALQTVTLSTVTGSVAIGGPSGINRSGDPSDTMMYAPAGYDPVYAALTFNAAGNALDANIAVGAGKTLSNPLIIVRGYTGAAYPTTVKLGVATLAIDVDYFPSLRSAQNELWITLNSDLGGATNHLQVIT